MPEPATHPAVSPFALRQDEGERLIFGDTTILVRASADSTGGAFTVFEESPPVLDTSRHVHANEDEMYYVLEGEHVFVCGDQEFRLGPGGMVFLPRGIPHEHRRVVPKAGRLLSMASPAGFKGFFRVLADAHRVGEPSETAYARASEAHGITWL
jgi:mannose-6-phosphate isomerase-like protein (cupin superfamily)